MFIFMVQIVRAKSAEYFGFGSGHDLFCNGDSAVVENAPLAQNVFLGCGLVR